MLQVGFQFQLQSQTGASATGSVKTQCLFWRLTLFDYDSASWLYFPGIFSLLYFLVVLLLFLFNSSRKKIKSVTFALLLSIFSYSHFLVFLQFAYRFVMWISSSTLPLKIFLHPLGSVFTHRHARLRTAWQICPFRAVQYNDVCD